MRVTGLVERVDHVCCRYRLAAFRPWLEQAGFQLELRPLFRHWSDRFHLGRSLRHADAVIWQRKLLPWWQLRQLRRGVRRLLFDFDDAVFLRDSYASKGLHSARRQGRFAAVVRAADAVVAGNAFLATQAASWSRTGQVQVIPTCVDPGQYPLAEHVRKGPGVELVWIGSASTLRGLEAIRPILEEVGRRHPGVCLKLVCDRFLRLQHLPVRECVWSEAGEALALAAADIGISWVPEDLWSRGKCGLKILQYFAAGLPVVANPVGVQAEMVRHGETGFLARTPEQWVEAVGRLAHDPDLRRRLGQAGRKLVESQYSPAVGAAQWITLLEGMRDEG
ncbi:MAG: glycosyltransferase family 4 protein [Planctomycetes bacterium]|nr:glycosyltransferase family 4 protein [Planctomycetota bacterium]